VMVNNSTNINNDISHQIIEHRKKKTYDIRNPGPDLVHAHICGKSRDRHTYVTIVNVLC
jgi:hypothetical protein